MIDALEIQRLVDAELSAEQIRALLIDAEDDPRAWRLIALGFIENQIWQQTFTSIDAGEIIEPLRDAIDRPGTLSSPHSRSSGPPSADHPGRTFPTFPLWGIALGLLISLGLGYLIGSRPGQRGEVQHASTTTLDQNRSAGRSLGIDLQNESIDSKPATSQPDRAITQVSYRPEYRIRLLDDQGNPVDAEIPLYTPAEAHELDYQWPSDEIPDELEQLWSDAGYYVDQQLDFLSGKLDADGRRFIVPIRTLKLTQAQ